MHIEKTDSDEAILDGALGLWGLHHQIGKVSEECGELLTSLNQFNENRATKEAVAEEVADVIIMMAQMSKAFGDELVQSFIDKKLSRLSVRIASRSETIQGW